MNKIKVSVLIPSYNYAHYLSEAIESVLTQTYQDFELIIVDNCSEDNTKQIVEKYIKKDSRVKLYVNNTNIGMYRNYNQALSYANGEYIKFLNADDKFDKNLLKKFVEILDKFPSVSLVTSYRQYFGDTNEILKFPYSGKYNGLEISNDLLIKGNFIGEPTTVMFRKSSLNIGLFNIDYKMFADFDMWFRLSCIGDVYFIPEVLSYFRIHKEQGTKYLNDLKLKSLTNELQTHFYILNRSLFHEDIKNENSLYLFNKTFKRITRVIAKNIKYTKKFTFFFKLKFYLIYYVNRLIYIFK